MKVIELLADETQTVSKVTEDDHRMFASTVLAKESIVEDNTVIDRENDL